MVRFSSSISFTHTFPIIVIVIVIVMSASEMLRQISRPGSDTSMTPAIKSQRYYFGSSQSQSLSEVQLQRNQSLDQLKSKVRKTQYYNK
jgi:hypothetical protein